MLQNTFYWFEIGEHKPTVALLNIPRSLFRRRPCELYRTVGPISTPKPNPNLKYLNLTSILTPNLLLALTSDPDIYFSSIYGPITRDDL